jgi:hypothetical protein
MLCDLEVRDLPGQRLVLMPSLIQQVATLEKVDNGKLKSTFHQSSLLIVPCPYVRLVPYKNM